MPSLRARTTNAFLRIGTKRRWRPDLDVQVTRERVRRMDARLSGTRAARIAVEEVDAGGVPAGWHGDRSRGRRGTLLYLHGFVSGKNGELKVPTQALAEATDRVIEHCIDRPGDKLLQVFEQMRKKK